MADPNVTASSDTPAAGTTTVTTPAAGTTTTADSTAAASTQVTAPAKPAGTEDAAQKGILADLQKERKARQAFEKQIADISGRLTERDRQIAALTGTKSDTPEEAEVKAVRERFAQIFPALAKLDDKQIERLIQLSERAGDMEETVSHHWTQHGASMLGQLETAVASELGGEKLTDRQRKALSVAYIQEAQVNPEFLERHQKGDKALIAEFAKQWVDDWFEPARRKVTQTTVSRAGRPVPRSGASQPVTTVQPAKPKNLDEVTDRAVEYLKEHGLMS